MHDHTIRNTPNARYQWCAQSLDKAVTQVFQPSTTHGLDEWEELDLVFYTAIDTPAGSREAFLMQVSHEHGADVSQALKEVLTELDP